MAKYFISVMPSYLISKCLKLCFVALCLISLNSCTIKLSYHLLDNILGWHISKYVTLKGEQKKFADQALDDFHDWHRETQLILYADYLENLKQGMLNGPITAEYLHQESDKLQSLIDISMEQILPTITTISAGLSESQIQEVIARLEKDKQEYQEDYIDDSEKSIQKRRIRDLTRYIKGFFGRFTDEQKQRLVSWESSLENHEPLMLNQQETWKNDFREAMAFQDQPTQLQSKLRALMLYRTDNWDIDLQKKLDINQDLTFDLLADLFNSQTPKQRKKMARKFDQYIRDLNSLSKVAKSKAADKTVNNE